MRSHSGGVVDRHVGAIDGELDWEEEAGGNKIAEHEDASSDDDESQESEEQGAGSCLGRGDDAYEPLPPGADARLRGVDVHLSYGYRPKVLGLTFILSDGSERAVGETRGTRVVNFSLEAGEGIVSIDYKRHNHRPRYTTVIRFHTTSGRVWACDDSANTKYGWSTPAIWAPAGEVIEYIGYDKMSLLVTGEPTTAPAPAPFAAGAEPKTLFAISGAAAAEKMRFDSMALEEDADADAVECRESHAARVAEVYERARDDLANSEEASAASDAEALLQEAVRRLAAKQTALMARADGERDRIQAEYASAKSKLAADRKRKRDDLYDDHLRCNSILKLHGSGGGDDALGLCAVSDCRARYDPRRVPQRRRCAVDGCPSRDMTCGCNVEPCHRCHVPICGEHAERHEASCAAIASSRCGYFQDEDTINPACCGKILDQKKLAMCFYCNTICCPSCHDTCSGGDGGWRECGAVWCNGCLLPYAGVGEACCNDCSFHRDQWVR